MLVDFGIARASNVERRTATGVGKGTPAYMSPEQCMGRLVDERGSLSVNWPKERCRTAKEELALFPEVSAT